MGLKNAKAPKILFLYNHSSTFIHNDLVIFKNKARVVSLECNIEKRFIGFILSMIKEFVFILKNLSGTTLIYCWFADYHAFFPAFVSRITRKPFYLVLGGYDVSFMPEYNYGSFSNFFRGFCAKYALRQAQCNLPVSENLASEAVKRAGDISVHVLPTGYDPEKIVFKGQHKKDMVITAALVQEMQTFAIKGIDRFIELARVTPELNFVVVGASKELVSNFELPVNLQIIRPLSQPELYEWFGAAKFYAQLSRSEGMPNALCEAMLMECIPLGTNAGGIAAVIQKFGLVVDPWDPLSARSYLLEHLNDEYSGKNARESIVKRFHLNKRVLFLEELVEKSVRQEI